MIMMSTEGAAAGSLQTGEGRRSTQARAQQSAWLAEMERAILDVWFAHPALTPHQEAAPTIGASAPAGQHDGRRERVVETGRATQVAPDTGATPSTRRASTGDSCGAPQGTKHPSTGKTPEKTQPSFSGYSAPQTHGRTQQAGLSAAPIQPESLVSMTLAPEGQAVDVTVAAEMSSAEVPHAAGGDAFTAEITTVMRAAGVPDVMVTESNPLRGLSAQGQGWPPFPFIETPAPGTVMDSDAVDARVEHRPGNRGNSGPVGQPPVRVHADWLEGGVRIWLGIDAHSSQNASMLSQILVQWFGQQRVPVLSLVCNGRELTLAAVPAQADDMLDERHDSSGVASETGALAQLLINQLHGKEG